jgi:hypothetical protein
MDALHNPWSDGNTPKLPKLPQKEVETRREDNYDDLVK